MTDKVRTEDVLSLRGRLSRAEGRSAELGLIVEMARSLARSVDISAVASIVTQTAVELTGAAESVLWHRMPHGQIRLLARASGIPAQVIPLPAREAFLLKAVQAQEPIVIDGAVNHLDGVNASYVALPLHFDDVLLGALELVGFPEPDLMAEQLATLKDALPIAALSLQNALVLEENNRVSARLREALSDLQLRQEQLTAQNEQILAQTEELLVQNEVLVAQQRELEEKSNEIENANARLSSLYQISQEQEARMRAIIDATADGLLVVGGDHRIMAINPALEAMLGVRAAELVGRQCSQLLGAKDAERHPICEITCPLLHAPGGAPQTVDAVITTADGRQIWVNVAYGVIYDADGKVSTVVHAVRDIDSRKELERQKDEFLSHAAHDLKNPLTTIRGHTQLLMLRLNQGAVRPEDLKRLAAIDSQVGRMTELIARLLDLARIQMGRLDLRPEHVDLAPLCQRVLEQIQVVAEGHRLALSVDRDGLGGTWDRLSVERVLTNLVDNAIKYTPVGGTVTVSLAGAVLAAGGDLPLALYPCPAESDPTWVVVSVIDQGAGIAPDEQESIFQRYYRTQEAKETKRGLGLGLYIAKALVEAHGGRIWVESVPGRGASFRFALPVSQEPSTEAGPLSSSP